MLATVVIIPVVLLAMLFVVQFGIAYYARQVLAGATQDGAAAGARQGSTPAAGAALTDQLVDEAGGNMLHSHSINAASNGDVVTVSATAEVVSLLPFLGTITVQASATAKVEQFDPQGNAP